VVRDRSGFDQERVAALLLQALRRPQLEKSMQMVSAREDDLIASEIEWLGLERDEGFLPLIASTCETSACRQW
jgi:hypothetical protein